MAALAQETAELAARVAEECKSLRTLINANSPDLSALNTSATNNLVAAVNEVWTITQSGIEWNNIQSKPLTFAPSAHKTSHATGGSDELTAADIGAAPTSHTHTASQISDSTTTGRSLMTAANASAARTTLELGNAALATTSTGGNGSTDSGKVLAFGSNGEVRFAYFVLVGGSGTGTLSGTNLTGTRSYESPDANGTLALTSSSTGIPDNLVVSSTKTTPVDADSVLMTDSEVAGTPAKRLTFANLWTWITTKLGGNLTIGGTKTWSGQQEATGQSATNGTSLMTRDLGDTRYKNTVADFDYSSNTVSASGGSGTWTWTPPATARLLRITCVSAGSGGGSGRCGASGSDRSGGGGGASGVITIVDVPTSFLSGGALTITVGAGGAGGAAVTANDTNGNDGATGGDTSVADGSQMIALANNNGSSVPRGKGGSTTSGTAGGAGFAYFSIYPPTAGSAGSNGNGTAKIIASFFDGGAGGGGLNTSNTIGRGGVNASARSGAIWGYISTSNQSLAPTAGIDGGEGTAGTVDSRVPVGPSGTGGNGGLTVKGGNGMPGIRGGGGGGGGAGTNGTGGSGAGGKGGDGFVRIEVIA